MLLQELHPERGVAVAGAIGLAVFGPVLLLFLVPFVRGVVQGLRSGDWWSPFVQREDGRWGVLAASRYFALFRAPEPARRTRGGLVARWAFWVVVVVALSYLPAQFAAMALAIL
ncbi:hypothetical protein KMZ32_00900 [Phycicoccus sp. MAQZ13P-2]|uniref:hypothetical protein n=1 Tax=Phycicoccus mangrovi TaxID=2840470 RepID=UPI001C004E6D|nr:hypothetical protein [Phycicoccus mangrovi]MBT9254249.1 hypothetical protein [Phycicoccus mangrovi]MBT9272627.1 hypothetical protein [Phycicoccus mangrovi]